MRMEMVFDIKYIWKIFVCYPNTINMTWSSIQYNAIPLHIHFNCEFHLFYGGFLVFFFNSQLSFYNNLCVCVCMFFCRFYLCVRDWFSIQWTTDKMKLPSESECVCVCICLHQLHWNCVCMPEMWNENVNRQNSHHVKVSSWSIWGEE